MGLRSAWLRRLVAALAQPPGPLLVLVAALALAALAVVGHGRTPQSVCISGAAETLLPGWRSLRLAWLGVEPLMLLRDWLLMLVAMMAPLLATPLQHVAARSLPRRRARSVLWFLCGYLAPWLVLLVPAVSVAWLLGAAAGATALPVVVAIAAVAMLAPAHQRALNRCHRRPPLAAFGRAADRDACAYGIDQAFACARTCGLPMLACLLAGDLHLPVMLLATAIAVIDRTRAPAAPRWRLPGNGTWPQARAQAAAVRP